MRMSVWNKPRVIGCAENYPQHIALPRGCLDSALSFLRYNNIAAELIDKRFAGTECNAVFTGNLRAEQEEAVSALPVMTLVYFVRQRLLVRQLPQRQ